MDKYDGKTIRQQIRIIENMNEYDLVEDMNKYPDVYRKINRHLVDRKYKQLNRTKVIHRTLNKHTK